MPRGIWSILGQLQSNAVFEFVYYKEREKNSSRLKRESNTLVRNSGSVSLVKLLNNSSCKYIQ